MGTEDSTRAETAPTICIAILTLNEAARIKRCIDSAKWAEQVVVADSGSTDGTQAIVRAQGVEIYDYPDWKGFAEQRNRLLTHCKSDYVFFLDADEELTPELKTEIQQVVQSRSQHIWRVGWELVAFGKKLSAMSAGGGVQRLFVREHIVRFEGVVHERATMRDPNTPVSQLKNRLPHHSRETVYASILKLAQYVQLGAAKRRAIGKKGGVMRGIASALANFLRLYFGQRGFLCGGPGFVYCVFVSLECFFRYVALDYDKDNLDLVVRR
jgi:glycosyltransferase involved in cell wall biosynthesis